jgi:hypothetical protein
MSHNRDLSAAAGQFGFHSSNIGIGSEAPRYPLDVHGGNLLVSGSAAGNIILEDRGVGDSSRPFALLASNDGNFTITSANRNASGTTTSSAERLRITSDGHVRVPTGDLRVGDDTDSNAGSQTISVGSVSSGSGGIGIFANPTDGNSWVQFGDGTSSADQYRGYMNYRHADDSLRFGTAGTERLHITSAGKFGFNTTNPGAFDSGANHLVLLGNTSGTGNAGITISSGTDSYGNIYFADGTSGADAYRGHIAYNHNGNTMRFATNGTEKVRILSSGFVNIGSGYLTNSNSGLHVGRASGGTAAGESVIAATLGDNSTMVSALLTVKNAGNRGAKGASGGSSLAKFDFNNGTAFEVNKYGQVTMPYQPSFKVKLSAATGANFTGVLVFNSVSYNIGSHYNTSNGRFTAPIDGRYLFAWYTNMERAGGNGSLYAEWYINGNAQGNRMYTHHSGAWELIGGTIIFDLNQNDYVHIQAITSGNWDGNQYGSYSGCLLG